MRLHDLDRVLRDAGLTVIEEPGWRSRGADLARVDAIIWHHTVTGPTIPDRTVANLLRDGHSTLPGPLSQLGLDRQGRYWLIASGRCNHNGYGAHGNQTIGIEAYNSGTGEPWPRAQVDAYVAGAAALGRAHNVHWTRQLGHKETDPRRKIDPAGLDMDEMRRRVAATPAHPRPKGPLMALTDAEQRELLAKVRSIDTRSRRSLGWLTFVGEWVAGKRRMTAKRMAKRVRDLTP